ncbi:MAG TPA: hypothetical protein VGA61_14035 [Anaerolineae bacterium]
MNILTGFGVAGGVFLLTLASGLWLSRSGKPLNTGIFTVHKLIALGAVIAAATSTYSGLKGEGIQAIIVTLLTAAAVGVLALFVTGALMSMNRPAYGVLLAIHNVAPALVIVAMALVIHLLSRGIS